MPSDQIGEMFEVPGDRLRELTEQIKMLGTELQSANDVIVKLTRQKQGVYTERDRLVAALTKMWPSHITRHEHSPGEEWDKEWLNVICVHLPAGQATWHVHISELPWFEHLNGVDLSCGGYDGYSTEEKYQRVHALPCIWLHGLYVDRSDAISERARGPERPDPRRNR